MEFKELLSLATKESYFFSNGKLYKQIDGVAMGSLWGRYGVAMGSILVPTLANYFFAYFKKN